MNVDPDKAIEAVGKNLPIKEAYQDLVHAAAAETGIALGTLAGTLRLLLIPFELAIYQGDRIRERFMPDLMARLENVPPDRIQAPPLEIAGPVMEALRFTGHNEDLRRLYANLLGTAMDAETARTAHPAFVEVLKQLTPDEARAWQGLAMGLPEAKYLVMVEVRDVSASEAGGPQMFSTGLTHFTNLLRCEFHDLIPTYVTNWIRLGLLEIDRTNTVGNKAEYTAVEQNPVVVRAKDLVTGQDGHTAVVTRYSAEVTPFGLQFAAACIRPPVGGAV